MELRGLLLIDEKVKAVKNELVDIAGDCLVNNIDTMDRDLYEHLLDAQVALAFMTDRLWDLTVAFAISENLEKKSEKETQKRHFYKVYVEDDEWPEIDFDEEMGDE